jgi:hypothetical protein
MRGRSLFGAADFFDLKMSGIHFGCFVRQRHTTLCFDAADANDGGAVNIADAIRSVRDRSDGGCESLPEI